MARSQNQVLYDVHTHGVNLVLRDIYVHSYYTDDEENPEPGVEYRQATTFIKNLHTLDHIKNAPILVHLHSTGGCWDNGMAMFNAVEFCQSAVNMLAYSQASSMSGIIFQSAKNRVMMPDCHFLIHHGQSDPGYAHPFAAMNEMKRQIRACKRMLEIFANRALTGEFFKKRKGSTTRTAYDFLDRKLKKEVDWFLDADEAVYYGLADGIFGSKNYPDYNSLRTA